MFFIDNTKFDILYKNLCETAYDKSLLDGADEKQARNMKTKFVLNNSTLESGDYNEENLDDIFDFIYNKVDFTLKETFTEIVNETTNALHNKLFKLIMEMLIGIGYKISDIIKLNRKELIQTFILEILYNREKLNRDIFVQQLTEIFDEAYANELSDALGITASQKAKDEAEQKELIEQLRNL